MRKEKDILEKNNEKNIRRSLLLYEVLTNKP